MYEKALNDSIEAFKGLDETEYTISKTAPYEAYKDGQTITKGFFDIESTLHSIWVLNGKVLTNFYEAIDGVVYCREVEPDNG